MKIGFVNGCFDILHVGHVKLFEYAKSFCDYLVVAIDSDERVRANKGATRPFNCLEDRKLMLSSLRFIDEVESFSTDEELASLVNNLAPDVMIVGDDYMDKRVIGSEHAKELKFYRKVDGYSTTKILESSVSR